MYLKGIEINGFKSFADKIRLDLTRGITSIVGPNGSGKSNILDAILWVLGEQSYKNIRAKESSDVIFSGGKNKKAKSMAEVTLLIDNTDKILPIEYTDVSIGRRIYSSGENEYYINRNKVRLKDINELFMDTGIGKQAYSIIGQGKVERIILSSPKELKGIIEEAAGIKKVKMKKEEAEKKLKITEDNIEKIEYIESDVKDNLDPLCKQAEKAREYKEVKFNLRYKKKSIYTKEQFVFQNQQKGLLKKISIQEENIKNIELDFINEEKELERVNVERENLFLIIEKEEEKNKDIREKIEKNINEKTLFIERNSNLKREYEEKQEYLNGISDKIKLKDIKTNEFISDKNSLEKELNLEKESLNKFEIKLNENEVNLKKYEGMISNNKNLIMDNEIKKVRISNTIDLSKKKRNISIDKIEKLKKEKFEFENIMEKTKNELDIKYKNKEELNNEIKKFEFEKETFEKEIYNIKNDIKEKEKKQNDLLYQHHNKNSKLEALCKMEENFEGFFKGVKEVLNAKIDGVLGPFISVINIPGKMETALQSIVGNSMQDIIVENSSVAKKCIEYLKVKKSGRASFLPFDILIVNKNKKKIDRQGVLGYASELVNYDKKYEKIVEFVLGNILVVEKIENGIQIIKNNEFRGNIVSLDGEVISGKGKITGGEKVRNNMSLIFERKREIEILKEDLIKINDNKIELEEKIKTEKENENIVEEKTIELNKSLVELNNKNQDLEIDLNKLIERKRVYDKNMDTILFEEEEEEESIENTLKEIETFKKDEEGLKNETEKLMQDNLNYQNKILSLKENVEQGNKDFSEKRIILIQKDEQFKTLLNKIKEQNDDVKELIDNKNNFYNKLKEIESEIKKNKEKLNNIEIELNKNNKIYEDKTSHIKESKSSYKKFELEEKDKIMKVKELEKNIIIEKNDFSKKEKEMEKIEGRLDELENELLNLTDLEDVNMATNENEIKNEIKELEKKLNNIGDVNLLAIEEYEKLKEKYEFIANQKKDLVESKKLLRELIRSIEFDIINQFVDAYGIIRKNFNYMCEEVLNSSSGDIVLTDPENILNTGAELIVKFQNKKAQSLTLLSGGEKSMIAVAFIMSIFMYKPSPFTFFDEIEAALDETNTKKLLKMLKEFTDKSQFILITHNKETMKESDVLYGVTMNKEIGISKIISVNI